MSKSSKQPKRSKGSTAPKKRNIYEFSQSTGMRQHRPAPSSQDQTKLFSVVKATKANFKSGAGYCLVLVNDTNNESIIGWVANKTMTSVRRACFELKDGLLSVSNHKVKVRSKPFIEHLRVGQASNELYVSVEKHIFCYNNNLSIG